MEKVKNEFAILTYLKGAIFPKEDDYSSFCVVTSVS